MSNKRAILNKNMAFKIISFRIVFIISFYAILIFGCTPSIYRSSNHSTVARNPFFIIPNPLPSNQDIQEANQHCNNFKEKYKKRIVSKDNPQQLELNKILKEIIQAYSKMQEKVGIHKSMDRYQFFYDNKISLTLFAMDEPWSRSYPNGEIHISTSFFNKDFPFGAKNENQKKLLLAHEVSHILQGHTVNQWKIINKYDEFLKDKQSKFNISNLTLFLPISFTTSSDVISLKDESEIYLINNLAEHLADIYTILLAEIIGIDPNEYITNLNNMQNDIMQSRPESIGMAKFIQYRIQCIHNMLNIKPETLPPYLVINIPPNQYKKIIIYSHPFAAKFIGYWLCALQGYNNVKFDKPYITDMMSSDANGRAIKTSTALAFPAEISGLPLFPFLNN